MEEENGSSANDNEDNSNLSLSQNFQQDLSQEGNRNVYRGPRMMGQYSDLDEANDDNFEEDIDSEFRVNNEENEGNESDQDQNFDDANGEGVSSNF